ncbi:MAG: glycosyltransferase family 39 protein, partial [Albidovulum sp.]
MAIAVILRLWNLDVRALTHPEIYIPGIDLLPGISEPPPRHDWLFSIWWHFHDEPHAMGYYLGMQIWTTIAGTSEFALRLPGVVMGTLSVFLVAAIATKTYGRNVGVIVALLLTLHGFHIFLEPKCPNVCSGGIRWPDLNFDIGSFVTVESGILALGSGL